MAFKWTKISDDTLALEGHPVQIKLLPETDDWNFAVFVRDHKRHGYMTLPYAKTDGERMAAELSEFSA